MIHCTLGFGQLDADESFDWSLSPETACYEHRCQRLRTHIRQYD